MAYDLYPVWSLKHYNISIFVEKVEKPRPLCRHIIARFMRAKQFFIGDHGSIAVDCGFVPEDDDNVAWKAFNRRVRFRSNPRNLKDMYFLGAFIDRSGRHMEYLSQFSRSKAVYDFVVFTCAHCNIAGIGVLEKFKIDADKIYVYQGSWIEILDSMYSFVRLSDKIFSFNDFVSWAYNNWVETYRDDFIRSVYNAGTLWISSELSEAHVYPLAKRRLVA